MNRPSRNQSRTGRSAGITYGLAISLQLCKPGQSLPHEQRGLARGTGELNRIRALSVHPLLTFAMRLGY